MLSRLSLGFNISEKIPNYEDENMTKSMVDEIAIEFAFNILLEQNFLQCIKAQKAPSSCKVSLKRYLDVVRVL